MLDTAERRYLARRRRGSLLRRAAGLACWPPLSRVILSAASRTTERRGGFTNAKLIFDLGHNNHYHITLDSAQLINSP